jgi:hypothetical protein
MNQNQKNCLPGSSAASYAARPAAPEKIVFLCRKNTNQSVGAQSTAVAQALHDGSELVALPDQYWGHCHEGLSVGFIFQISTIYVFAEGDFT